MKLSIVATLYKSERHIHEFCQRACLAARKIVGDDYEVILVNDGSPDRSLEIAVSLMEDYPQLTVVDLSRNFGHHKAMMTGLAHASGDKIFLLDSDLEEEPEWLSSFSRQMEATPCDVVYGVQKTRKGGLFERFSGAIFYKLLQLLTRENLPENITVARLMTKRYVAALLLHTEQEVYIAGLWHITGYVQQPQFVKKHSSSVTTYSFNRKISLFINSITSFSNMPLMGIFYCGILIMLFASSYTLFLVINKFVYHQTLSGWTSLMASIWLLGGLIISFVGIIGVYLSKIFIEIKRRPYTIVRHIYKRNIESSFNTQLLLNTEKPFLKLKLKEYEEQD